MPAVALHHGVGHAALWALDGLLQRQLDMARGDDGYTKALSWGYLVERSLRARTFDAE